MRLRALCRRLLRALRVRNCSVGVFLLSEAEMRRLGRKCIKKGSGHIPNVLSFAEPKRFPHPETRGKFLGEIYLNRDLRPLGERRLGRLLIHGFLHILGYTHDKKHDTLKMEKLEKKLIKVINSN